MRETLILAAYVFTITAFIALDIAVMRRLAKRIDYLEYDLKGMRRWLGENGEEQRRIRSRLTALESTIADTEAHQ